MPRAPKRARKGRKRAYAYAFTVFMQTTEDGNVTGEWQAYPHWSKRRMQYHCIGKERCPDTFREHLQGYVYYKTQVSFSTMKKKYPQVHFEDAKGTPKQNRTYCKKDGDFTERGKLPKKGKRNDITRAYDAIAAGTPFADMLAEHHNVMVRYPRGLMWASSLLGKKRNWKMNVLLYIGDPGCGKTRAAVGDDPDLVYMKPHGKWWDHYNGEPIVVIDDFDPHTDDWKFKYWLTLTDRYQMIIEKKGSSMHFCSKTIIITSNFSPKYWFNAQKNRAAFFRRVTQIKVFLPEGATIGYDPQHPDQVPATQSDCVPVLNRPTPTRRLTRQKAGFHR